jgi:preprotein translocase subunit YajC
MFGEGGIGSLLPFVLMFVVVYFFMIAPQMKRAKKEKKFAADLKRGDKVITKSGLHGKVLELNDKDASCVLETMSGKLKYERSAISMEMSAKLNAPVIEKK